MPIDYARMQTSGPKLKASLTRAKKRGLVEVRDACQKAVKEWDAIGCWPDNWSLWQRTLDDAAAKENQPYIRLEELS